MAGAVDCLVGTLSMTPWGQRAAGVPRSRKAVLGMKDAACVRRPFERDKHQATCPDTAKRSYGRLVQEQRLKRFSSPLQFDFQGGTPFNIKLAGARNIEAPCLLHDRGLRLGGFLRAHHTRKVASRSLHRTREGAFCRTQRTIAAATNDARTYPKVQTGVTLKWVSPNQTSVQREKQLRETVLTSICPDAAAEKKQKVEFTVTTVAWRKRHISASVEVEAGLEKVWQVLTDYERLADFIPNLAKSERIPCPTRGRIWLLQLGVQSSMYWQIEARVVLDLEERFSAPGGPELHFSMVEGDFKLFAGKWALRESDKPGHVTLHYEVDVLPRAILPTAFVERIIQADLPRNLRAIANRAQILMTSHTDPDVALEADHVPTSLQDVRTDPAPSVTSSENGAVTSSENGAGTSSANGAGTSFANGAVTSSSEHMLRSHASTALPPSLVTVATGAGAGLNLEVSWWSGPGQPPTPGLISPENAVKVTSIGGSHTDTAEAERGERLQIEAETHPNGVNGRASGVIVTDNGLLVGGVAELGAENGTSAALETVLPPALPPHELGPYSEPAQPGDNGQTKGGREMPSEPVLELEDAPYFPAECPVISPDDKAVRAQLRHRVDEVHLRRMDDLLEKGGVHRRVVAAITVAATPEVVWEVLTDYEGLQDFIPNLVKSKVVSRHPDEQRVRLHQIGVKCLCYMVLHAQTTMDVTELPHKELRFSQVSGDFDSFEGRWFLEPLGPGHTLLKYAVETRVRRNSLLPESLVEEVIYEDLPANLCAIRKRVESNKSIYSDPSFRPQENHPPDTRPSQPGGRTWGSRTPRLNVAHVSEKTPRKKMLRKLPVSPCAMFLDTETVQSSEVKSKPKPKTVRAKPKPVRANSALTTDVSKRKKPKVDSSQTPARSRRGRPALGPDYSDFNALKAALSAFVETHGVLGVMPSRAQLRGAGRADLERGMLLHGGPSSVAAKLALRVQHEQKPARYWCDLGNIEKEIRAFQATIGLEADVMPTRRALERAGRFDIARALEKWGGANALAAKLNLKTAKKRQGRQNGDSEVQNEAF